MAPSKSSRNADEHKVDGGAPKEKGTGHHAPKMRRGASQMSASQFRDVANAPTSAPAQNAAESAAPTINWSSFDRDALHAYRREHQLNTPTSFSSTYHEWVLSQPHGIGLYSPTMVSKRKSRRQGKDHLAMAVRKHFNGLGVQENDVIVDFIYKIRCEKAAKANGPNKQGFLVAN
ncbi:hypothetical protein HIM_02536 [Hirsutella minnesotensis 3608]|nr:hypothetical protein HIM_02536 [Hirsutella minnesotensis 3608]